MAKKNREAEETALATRDAQGMESYEVGNGLIPVSIYKSPAEAFKGFQGRIYPPVWKFSTPGESIDATVIGESAPLTKNDPVNGEIPIVTYELAFSADFRIRLQCQHQLVQMLPDLEGKLVRLCFREEKDHGKNRVYIYDAAIFADQSRAVPLTPDELARNQANRDRREAEAAAKAAERRTREAARREAMAALQKQHS